MKALKGVCLMGFILLFGCATTSIPKRSTNEAMLNFLPYLNQKVAGYLSINKVKTLDAEKYKEIVNKVCSNQTSCIQNSNSMFNTYSIETRMLNEMFSVMLCDKDNKIKVMEDFSCNEQKVEIPSFEIGANAKCQFEDNWKEATKPYCP